MTPLDDLYTEHWAFDELCAGFECETCVATDEDLGPLFPGPDLVPERGDGPVEDWETPF